MVWRAWRCRAIYSLPVHHRHEPFPRFRGIGPRPAAASTPARRQAAALLVPFADGVPDRDELRRRAARRLDALTADQRDHIVDDALELVAEAAALTSAAAPRRRLAALSPSRRPDPPPRPSVQCPPDALVCPRGHRWHRLEMGEGSYAFGYCDAKVGPDRPGPRPRCGAHFFVEVRASVATVTQLDGLPEKRELSARLRAAREQAPEQAPEQAQNVRA